MDSSYGIDRHWGPEKVSHVLHLSSKDCQRYNPSNTDSDFITDLTSPLILDGSWSCALYNLVCDAAEVESDELMIFCDLCDTSFIHERQEPILRRVLLKQKGRFSVTPDQIFYVPVVKRVVRHIRLYLRTENFQETSFGPRETRSTLVLQRHIV